MLQRLKRGGWPYSQPPNVLFDPNKESEQYDDLAAWWPMIPDLGTRVLRDLGNGNQGAFGAGAEQPAWMATEQGPAVSFDGGDVINVPDSPSVSVTGNFTLTAWVYPLDNGANRNILAKDSNNAYRWRVTNADALWLLIEDGGGLETETSALTVQHGVWQFTTVSVNFGTGDVVFRLDGQTDVQNTTAVGVADTAGTLAIGALNFAGGEGWFGYLRDIRIYNAFKTVAQTGQMRANPWEFYRPRIRRLWAMAPAAPPVGQPMMLRGTTVPGLRQWHPRV